jgi:hypothetical protein
MRSHVHVNVDNHGADFALMKLPSPGTERMFVWTMWASRLTKFSLMILHMLGVCSLRRPPSHYNFGSALFLAFIGALDVWKRRDASSY